MSNINQSIKLASGFLLKNSPVDLKATAATIAERNSYVALGNNVLYKGAIVYVEEDSTFYVYTGVEPSGEDYGACFKRLLPEAIDGGDFATLDGTNAFTGANSFTQAPTVNGQAVATTEDVSNALSGAIGSTVQAHSDQLDKLAALETAGFIGRKEDGSIANFTVEGTSGQVKATADNTAGKVTIALENVGTAGTYTKVTTDDQGRITAGENPTTLAGYGITDALPLSGGTMTGALKVLDPVAQEDAVNKKYADSIALGFVPHEPVKYASTANVEGVYADGTSKPGFPGVGATFTMSQSTIDGQELSENDRVLLIGQTDQKQNGIYKVTAVSASTSATLTRADDFDGEPTISYDGLSVLVSGGTKYGTVYTLQNRGELTFGTDNIVFIETFVPNGYSAGTGINIADNVVSVKVGTTVQEIAGKLEVASGSGNQGKVLVAGGEGAAATWQELDLSGAISGTLPVGKGGTGATSLAANQLIVGNGTEAVTSVANAEGVLVGTADGAPTFAKADLTKHVQGVLPVANGGFGTATHTEGAIVVGGADNTLSEVAPFAGVLKSTGTGAPVFSQVDLAADVTGTLSIANGGTGATEKAGAFAALAPTAATKGDIMYYDGAQWVAFGKGAEGTMLMVTADGLKWSDTIDGGLY